MMNELARRIAITIGALLIYRLGCHIPLPGITSQRILEPGVIARISIFSLSLIPYLSAAIIIQLVSVVWKRLGALERSGEAGRNRISRYTLVLTLLIASFQAFGIASALQNISALGIEPGPWFVVSTIATMVGGVIFLVWLSEQITRYGIANGLALILCVEIVVSLPSDVAYSLELLRQGAVSSNYVLSHAVLWVAVVAVIVLVEDARREVPVQYVARQAGHRRLPPRASVLPIKINNAGFLIPVTVAPWIFYLPLAFATLVFGQTPWLRSAFEHLQFGRPVHVILGSIAVFVLAFIYTANVLDPERSAQKLLEQGGVIPGVMPGEPTADYLDRVVSLTTVVGAVYLVALSLIPEALVAGGVSLPYNLGGASALIVVCTMLDIRTQVRGLSRTSRGGELK